MPTILLVEDQTVFRENLAEALEDHGYAVVRAGDADEALANADQFLIDLFVLDVALPGRSGLELLKMLQSKPAFRRIPAIFLSAYPRIEAMEEASRMGIGDFLVKSDISLKDLLERIDRGLRSVGESTTAQGGGASTDVREDPLASRRHLRPALRRWRPQAPRPQCKELYALASEQPSRDRLLSHLAIDPEAAKWLRRILSDGKGADAPLEAILDGHDPGVLLRHLLVRAVVDGAMLSVEPSTDLRRIWKRALIVGLLAEELSPPTAFATRAEAFLAGLCSAVPWVFAVQALETDFAEVKAESWEEGTPIHLHLASAFATDPATLALETVKSLDVPDTVWKAVVDRLGKRKGSPMWEPGHGGRVLDIVADLAHCLDVAWHPCLTVRAIHLDEAEWMRGSDLAGVLAGIAAKVQEIQDAGGFPEAFGILETRSAPVSDAQRRFLLLRSSDFLVPDPFEAVLRRFGEVELVESVEALQSDESAVRVAVAEPGSETWSKVIESTRRVVLFHTRKLPRHLKLGPHAHQEFPVTLTAIEEALRPKT